MSPSETAKGVRGRRIVRLVLHPFPARDYDKSKAYAPVFLLDNGDRVRFVVQETDGGEYGVLPVLEKGWD